MKQKALNLVNRSGFFAPFRYFNRKKLLILMYHRFSMSQDEFSTSARDLEVHLKYLQERYNVVSLAEASLHLSESKKPDPRTAVVTIDDGYRDSFEVALPLFSKYHIPATIFVVTDFIDRKKWLWTDKTRFLTLNTKASTIEFSSQGAKLVRHLSDRTSRMKAAGSINSALKKLPDAEKEQAIEELAQALKIELPPIPGPEFEALTWDEAREMDKCGIEIGSHTVTHPILTRVDDDRLKAELQDSKSRLESALGRKVPLFCYPNGATDDHVTNAVRAAGYACAVTATPGFNSVNPDPLRLSRIAAENDLAHFAQSVSGFENFKNTIRPSSAIT